MRDGSESGTEDEQLPVTAKGRPRRVTLGRRAQAAARRVAESKATIPHLYATRTVELAVGEPTADLTATVIAALGAALREQPALNSAYRDGELQIHARINVGLTVESEDGILVPTLFDADKKGVRELETEIDALSGRVASGEITSPELAGGTITVTGASSGADSVLLPVIPGQAAHVGIGRSRDVPILIDGVAAAGSAVDLTISCDQRAAGPGAAAALLERLAELVAAPLPAN